MSDREPDNAESVAASVDHQGSERKFDWDVWGFISAAITLISAAIFYVAGWIYEAHWHSYYGIHLSQIELSPPQIMVQGIPGILFFGLAILGSLALITISKRTINKTVEDVTFVIVLAYVLATVFLWFLLTSSSFGNQTWGLALREVQLALIPSFFIVFMVVLRLLRNVLLAAIDKAGATLLQVAIASRIDREYVRTVAKELRERFVQAIEEAQDRLYQEFLQRPVSFVLFLPNRIIVGFLRMITSPVRQMVHRVFFSELGAILNKAWQLGLGLSLLFLFLLSIAVSALMGEYDAHHGIRSLDGNWQLTEVFLLSDERIESLPAPQSDESEAGVKYGPLGLVAINETTLFLVDWDDWVEEGRYFQRKPNLYLVSRDDGGESNIHLFAPAPTLTPTPTLTATPTLSPTPLLTATLSP